MNRDLVIPYVDLNFGVQARYPKLKIIIEEPEDVDMILMNVDRMAQRGVRFKQSEIRQKMRFTDPDDDDEIIGDPAAPAKNSMALNRSEDGVEVFADLDALEVELNEDWEEVLDETLKPIQDLLAEAGSYEEARNRLADALPEMGSAKMIEGLVKAAFKARGLGDVSDG